MAKSSIAKAPKRPRRGAGPDTIPPEELRRLRAGCTRALQGFGLRSTSDVLAEITALSAEDLEEDWYGDGGAVTTLETEVRELLGKPAAVFMPSGTMAQQIALRIHADRRGRTVVGLHPTSHLELWEDKAYQRLHGLVGRHVGEARELITLADIEGIEEPLAALLIELPQREIGGRLPAWKDLVAQVGLARERGAAVHLDGARLWESGPFYGRPAGRDRRAVRHRVRVVLQGPRGAGGQHAARRGGRDRRGAGVAASPRRHAVQALAVRGGGAGGPAVPAATDAGVPRARPGHRRGGREARRRRRASRTRPRRR